ncbi:MAG: hypothetical protein JXA93_18055 [Anaerolineae bacterium]|nr:hypothetical protein [Anaerolineae bacterium]
MNQTIDWLLNSPEPWTRYRTLLDLLGRPADDPDVRAARVDMLAHPQIQSLVADAATWGTRPFKRHNDAGYTTYTFTTLAEFGLKADDPGMAPAVEAVLAHRSPEGAFQTVVNISRNFGGTGEDAWTWIICDTPTILYVLLRLGLAADGRVQRAVDHLVSLVDDNGWRCVGSPDVGKFRGPGRKDDPCPIANVYALKAIAAAAARGRPDLLDGAAACAGIEMLLSHWEQQGELKMYLFGIGTDFRKLKYPFVWYDILHVAHVLSYFPAVHADPRFQQMVDTIAAQADPKGCYTATSMYKAWKGWSFADKKAPSPWLTFLALCILKRSGR